MMTETANVDPAKDDGVIWIKVNPSHFRRIPGMIKIAQLLVGIICMACATAYYSSATQWFLFVAIISFIITLVWVFVYLLSIREAINLPINWILTELVNTAILTVLYCIGFIVQLSDWSSAPYHPYKGSNIAAGVFGLFNTILYAVGSYLLFAEWRASSTSTT